MDINYFFEVTENFNIAFRNKLATAVDEYCDDKLLFSSDGRMLSSDFCGESGYSAPHSNQVQVGLVQRKTEVVEILVQQGPLTITTATVNFQGYDEDKSCALTLQTNPLSVYDVYPLHVYKHETDDFFQKNGYGRLALYFSLLYSVTSGMTMQIICENPITAYLLLLLFRSERVLEINICTNYPHYLHNMSEHENTHGEFKGFEDFNRLFSVLVPVHGDLLYEIHATRTNRAVVTLAIEEWIGERITGLSEEDFMAIYVKGPKLHDYLHCPRLQQDYHQFAHKIAGLQVHAQVDEDSD